MAVKSSAIRTACQAILGKTKVYQGMAEKQEVLEQRAKDRSGKQVLKHNRARSKTGMIVTYQWSLYRTLVRNAAWATPSL